MLVVYRPSKLRTLATRYEMRGLHPGEAEKLRAFRAEAAKLLGIPETPSTPKEKPGAK